MSTTPPPDAEKSPPAPTSPPKPKGRFRIGFWFWVVLAVAVVVGVLQSTELTFDRGVANVASMAVTALGGLIILAWFVFFTRLPWAVRLAGLACVVLAIAGFFVLFRFEGVSGHMVPQYSFRFAPRPAEGLSEDAFLADPPVDLRTVTPDGFSQFLGPKRNAAVEGVRLSPDWSTPPRKVWRQPIGGGWSGFAVRNGLAVTMEQRGPREMVTCYDLKTGRLVWADAIEARHDTPEGGLGPRSTPTIDDGMVYSLGATGRLRCLDGATGRLVWEKDLVSESGETAAGETSSLSWGRSNSPLVAGDAVVTPLGGSKARRVSLAAYDKKSGQELWRAGKHFISYSSPSLETVDGVEQVLSVNEDSVSGHDPASGEVLWEFEWKAKSNANPNASQAVPVAADRLLVTKGYGQGGAVFRVRRESSRWIAEQLWHETKVLKTKFTNVVLKDGHVYGLSDGTLECVEADSGRRVWKQGRYGHGQVLRVGELLLIVAEDGKVSLVELSPERPNSVLGRFQAVEGKTWNTLALAGPYLLVRNGQEAACYELPLAADKPPVAFGVK